MFREQIVSSYEAPGAVKPNGHGQLTYSSMRETYEWKAAYTRQHHEKSVATRLAEMGVECFLPVYMEERHWTNNRKPILELPLFPNYLFVRISPRSRIQVLRTPGVINLVGRDFPTDCITDEEIDTLRSGLPRRNPKPHPIAIGDHVRISSGPLAGFEGVVLRQKGTLRVVLTVPLIRQSVAVEVASDELETLCAVASC